MRLLEALLPDELFEEVMQGMSETFTSWLRERAAAITASGQPGANERAAALIEAADAWDNAPATADATP